MSALRWAACSVVEFGHVGEYRHLVAEGALDTFCNHSATYPEIWRANTRKPKCPTCEKQEQKMAEDEQKTKERDAQVLTQVRAAMKHPDVSLHFVQTFTHGRAVQVKIKNRKIGPFILPSEDQTLADVLSMLGTMALEPDET